MMYYIEQFVRNSIIGAIGIWALITSFTVFNETMFSVSWWLDIVGVIIGISLIVSGLFLGDKA